MFQFQDRGGCLSGKGRKGSGFIYHSHFRIQIWCGFWGVWGVWKGSCVGTEQKGVSMKQSGQYDGPTSFLRSRSLASAADVSPANIERLPSLYRKAV